MITHPNSTSSPLASELIAQRGLTKREYFAAQALNGFCADRTSRYEPPHRLATWAVQCADALIDALNAPTKEGERP